MRTCVVTAVADAVIPRSADCGNFTCIENVRPSRHACAPDDSGPEASVAVASSAMRIAIGLGLGLGATDVDAINHFSPRHGTQSTLATLRCRRLRSRQRRRRLRRQRPGYDGKVVSWSLIQRPQLAIVGINQQRITSNFALPILRYAHNIMWLCGVMVRESGVGLVVDR